MRMHQQLRRQLTDYTALKKERRAQRTADHVILGLVMANVVVYFGWQKVKRHPTKRNVMVDHFMTSYSHLERGKYYTLLTSVFSHGDLGHLFANMVGLYFFGTPICALVGRNRFLALYLGSGIVSSSAAVYEQKRMDRLAFNFGASGAVNAVTAMSILRHPRSTLLLFGLVPLPAGLAGSLFMGRDLYGWATDRQDGVGYLAHLSGAVIGGAYFGHLRYIKKAIL
jgi:rhomboid-like protein